MSDNRRGTYINRLSSRISSRLSTKVGSFGFHHAAKEPLKTRTAQFHGDVSHDVQCFAVKLNLMAFDYEEFLVTEGKVRREEKSTLLDEVRLMLLQAKKTLSIYEGTYVEAQDLLKRNAINLHKIMHPSNNHQETTGLPGRINSNDPQLYPAAFNPDQKGPSKPSQQYHRQSTESKRFSSFSSEASILPFDDVFLTQQTDTGPSLPPRPKLKLKAGFDDKIAYRRVGSTASNFTFSVDVRTEHGNTTDQSTEIDKSRLHKFHSGLGAASIKSKKSTKTNRKKSTMPKGKKFLPLRRNMTTVNPRGSMKIRTTKSRKLKIAGRGKKVKRTNSLFNPPNATTKGRNNSPSELTLVQTETQSQTGSVNLRHNADESACSEERRKFEQVHLIPLETCLRKLRSLIKELELQVKDLELKSRDLEMRTKQNGSVCGVYNEVTGQVEWKEFDHGGVCGVWYGFCALLLSSQALCDRFSWL